MIFGKYLNKYHLKCLPFFIIGIAALIACDWFQLKIPEILGQVVDKINENPSLDPFDSTFIQLILEVLKVAAILFVGRIVWRLTLFYASKKIEAGIRHDMFLKAERLSVPYYHENKVGNIMSWFTTDLETLEEYIGWGTLMLVDGVFLTILSLIKMFQLDWSLSLIALVPILLIAIWGALVEKFMSLKWKQRQESFDKLYDYSQEIFSGIRVIKAFVKENQQLHEFAKNVEKDREVNVNFAKISVIFDVIIEVIIAIVVAIIMGFGGWFVYATVTGNPIVIGSHVINLQPGKLVSFIGYFDTLIWPMIALGQVVTMFSKARTSYKRISDFLDNEEDVTNPENPILLDNVKGEIEFKNLFYKYPDMKEDYLKDISLKINAGEKIGIVGRVGSGKTSLAVIICRLFNVNHGQLFIDGVDIMDVDLKSLRNNIAYVPQDNFIFSDTIANNIAFCEEQTNMNDVIEASKFADVYENIMDFPKQFDTVSGERGQTLSGGQKQRVAIARAFLKKAPILIMDDSVSAVDVDTEEKILRNIAEQRKGQTTIVVASRVSTVIHFDKIIVLNNGTLEAFDTPNNLLKISPTFQKMVALQELEKAEGGEA